MYIKYKNYLHYTVLLIPALLLLYFPMIAQSWESYMYASALEGFFNISSFFALFQNGFPLPDISHYHPYHPLVHLLVSEIKRVLPNISALEIAICLNKIASLVTLIYFLKIFTLIEINKIASIITVLLIFFSKSFLFASFSGEAHLISFCFSVIGFYFILKYVINNSSFTTLAISSIYFVLSFAFNLATVFSFLLPGALLLYSFILEKKKKYILLLFKTALIYLTGFVFFYIYLFCRILEIDNIETYWHTLLIYTYMPFSKPIEFLPRIPIIFKSYLLAVIEGSSSIGIFLKTIFSLFVISGIIMFKKKVDNKKTILLVFSFLLIYLLNSLFLSSPKSINGVIFIFVPIFIVIAVLINLLITSNNKSKVSVNLRRIIFSLIITYIIIFSCHNFYYVIYRKSFPSRFNNTLMKSELVKLDNTKKLIFLIYNSQSLYPEIWHASYDLHFMNQSHIFPLIEKRFIPHLLKIVASSEKFYVISDQKINLARILPNFKIKNLAQKTSRIVPYQFYYSVNHGFESTDFIKKIYLYQATIINL